MHILSLLKKLFLKLKKLKDFFIRDEESNLPETLVQKIFRIFLQNLKQQQIFKKKQKLKKKPSKEDNENLEINEIIENDLSFLQENLVIRIKQAQASLEDLKDDILYHHDYNTKEMNSDFYEISQIYTESKIKLNQCNDHYYKYKQQILNSTPEEKYQKVRNTLDKVVTHLRKGQQLIDPQKNDNYVFVNEYLKERNRLAIRT